MHKIFCKHQQSSCRIFAFAFRATKSISDTVFLRLVRIIQYIRWLIKFNTVGKTVHVSYTHNTVNVTNRILYWFVTPYIYLVRNLNVVGIFGFLVFFSRCEKRMETVETWSLEVHLVKQENCPRPSLLSDLACTTKTCETGTFDPTMRCFARLPPFYRIENISPQKRQCRHTRVNNRSPSSRVSNIVVYIVFVICGFGKNNSECNVISCLDVRRNRRACAYTTPREASRSITYIDKYTRFLGKMAIFNLL